MLIEENKSILMMIRMLSILINTVFETLTCVVNQILQPSEVTGFPHTIFNGSKGSFDEKRSFNGTLLIHSSFFSSANFHSLFHS